MSITKKEKRIRSDGSGKGKKNVHSYSIKLFIFGKFEKMQHSIMKKSGALALCIQIRISLKGILW